MYPQELSGLELQEGVRDGGLPHPAMAGTVRFMSPRQGTETAVGETNGKSIPVPWVPYSMKS